MPFSGSTDFANYTAGGKIRCPGCHHVVGMVPPNTVSSVRKLGSYRESQPGTSVHHCNERTGRPPKKCDTLYEIRNVKAALAAQAVA